MRFVVLFLSLSLLLIGNNAVLAQADGATTSIAAAELAAAIANANPGDTIYVSGGVYTGSIDIDKSLTLIGVDWPVIDGENEGTVVHIQAPNTTIRGFVVRNSGKVLDQENSGIAIEAENTLIEGNRFENTLFGIYLRQAHHTTIRDNQISSKDLDVPRRGDPIRVWYSNDVLIENNVVTKGRDVVLWYSERLTIRNNDVSDGRYGLHFMYCDDAEISQNRLLNNSVGAFMMYSRRVHINNNTISGNRGPSGYGIGLKDMDDALIVDNLFLDNRVGAHLDTSPREVDSVGIFQGNVFGYNDIGIEMLPSVRHNEISGNSFIENEEQVAVGGGGIIKDNSWTVGEQGNYWSDYVGYDADGDSQGDIEYRADRLFENMLIREPALRLFIYSPATTALNFAARVVPMVKPQPKVVDTLPMLTPLIPNAPALPPVSRLKWALTGAVLLLGAVGLTWLPRLSPRRINPTDLSSLTYMDKDMIVVEHLSKRFGNLTAVDDLSFSVSVGEAVAFWGANGAGKTTAIRCLLNLIPYEGTITVGGLDVAKQGKEARRMMGFVPQELTFHDDLSVRETLNFYAALKKAATDKEFTAMLDRLALTAHLDKQVRDLSGGLKQRLALAIALLSDPQLLILDEPTSNLDIGARDDFLALLLELKHAGKTLIFSSHRLEEVTALADRVLLLEGGKLSVDAPPNELDQRLGWETTLHLYLPEEDIEPASRALKANNMQPSLNGRGIRIQLPAGQKAKALQILHEAGVTIEDFVVE